jgi:hypothetical protein
MSALIRHLRALTPSRDNPWLRRLAPYRRAVALRWQGTA